MKIHLKICWLMIFALVLTGCSNKDPQKQRIKLAKKKGDVVKIGIAWSYEKDDDRFQKGLELAASEINESGGILGRTIEFVHEDDEEAITKGRQVAQGFVNDPEILAVIGHACSYISVPCASIYEFGGLLMFSPRSTNPKLTRMDYKNIFQMIPNDDVIGKQIAEYALGKGYKKAAIFYAKNEYGKGLANSIEKRIEEAKGEVVDRLSYTEEDESYFRKVLRQWRDEYVMDVLFFAGEMPEGGEFVRIARESGITVPIISGDALDTPQLIKAAGKAAEGVIVASVFHPNIENGEVKGFVDRFQEKYGVMPHADAALAYDSVKTIAHAMKTAGTLVPDEVSKALHSLKGLEGVTGTHSFDENGNDTGMKVIMLTVKDSKFRYIKE